MLVLSRKVQQRIQIGNAITVSVLKIRGNVVSIGIEAPEDVRILRGEIPRFPDDEGAEEESSPDRTPRSGSSDGAPLRPFFKSRRIEGMAGAGI